MIDLEAKTSNVDKEKQGFGEAMMFDSLLE